MTRQQPCGLIETNLWPVLWTIVTIAHFPAKARFPLQRNHVFTFIRHCRNLFRLSSCWKYSTFVRPLADRENEQRIKFFGGEIFRHRRRNTLCETRLNLYTRTTNARWYSAKICRHRSGRKLRSKNFLFYCLCYIVHF